ncbi:septum formation initiator family protein [Acidicapsa dinghuensis]|uniref:Septum formation initiator family protein n=1 Tax=Acidicapsa dinghuensis TaxID=2218256 RepID=A0ABW1ELB4_9BACT|nr:septum formation initiator family protein [Acidicapsa dinghuensis]
MSPNTGKTTPKQSLFTRAKGSYAANRRRLGTALAVAFAILLAWHVVNGRDGLTNWQHKRAEDKALAAEIQRLTDENTHLSQHVDHLKTDPGAIEFEARQRLHYARPNEVIYALPNQPQKQTSPAQ